MSLKDYILNRDLEGKISSSRRSSTKKPKKKNVVKKFDLDKEINRLASDTPSFIEELQGVDTKIINHQFKTAKKFNISDEEITIRGFVKWAKDIVMGGTINLRRTIVLSRREVTFWNVFNIGIVNEHTIKKPTKSFKTDAGYLILCIDDIATIVIDEHNYTIVSMVSLKQYDQVVLEEAYFSKSIRFNNYYYYKPICAGDCILRDPTRAWNLFSRRIDREIFLESEELVPQDKLDYAVIKLAQLRFIKDDDDDDKIEEEEPKIGIINFNDVENYQNDSDLIILRFGNRFEDASNNNIDDSEIFDAIETLEQIVDPAQLTFLARISPMRALIFKVIR